MKKILIFLFVLMAFVACSNSKEKENQEEIGGKNHKSIVGKAWKFQDAKLIFEFNEDYTYVGEVLAEGNNNRFFGVYTLNEKEINLSSPFGQWLVPYTLKDGQLISNQLGLGVEVERRKLPELKDFSNETLKEVKGIFAKGKVNKEEINDYINTLTLEEKIGQMFTIGFWGTENIDDDYIEFIKNNHIGGLLVYSRNVLSYNHLVKLTNDLKLLNNQYSDIPLLMAIDNEGAFRVQLPANIPQGLLNSSIVEKINTSGNYDVGVEVGTLLHKLGINMNYGTIADIDFQNRDDGFMKMRAYSGDPEVVADYAISYSNGNKDADVAPVYKHFPGHGKTSVDSHFNLPKITLSKEELNLELLPYAKAIEKNEIDAIMTAHIIIEGIDNLPATLSKRILTGLLREEMKYDGVIITDDIEMAAIKNYFDLGEATIKTVEAGTDIILVCHTLENQRIAYDALLEAVESGRISEERINESVFRILSLKKKYNYSHNLNPYLDIEEESENMGKFLEKLEIKM